MTQEKTEEPTPHKLRKARKDGEAPKTTDFVTTSVTLLGFSILLGFSGVFGAEIMGFIQRSIRVAFERDFTSAAVGGAQDAFQLFATFLSPFLIAALVAAPLATVIGQGGLVFAKYKIKFEALSPATNLAQRFSKQNLLEFIKVLIRFTIIVAIFALIAMEAAPILMLAVFCGLDCAAAVARDTSLVFVLIVFGIMAAMALLDLVLQHALWRKKLRMSPDEVKREHKELEGDPEVKRERKSLARRNLAVTVEEGIEYAAAVFTDGDGRASAIYHNFDRDAPVVIVTLAGSGALAQEIVARADLEGVPLIREPRIVESTLGLYGMVSVEDPAMKRRITEKLIETGFDF